MSYSKKTFSFLVFCFCLKGISQTDTIYKSDGEFLAVNVTEVSDVSIKFMYPGENFSNSIGKNVVSKIRFKSGRVQDFASTLNMMQVKSCVEWENVQISNIESEVVGLSKIDVVGAKARGMTTMSSIAKLQDRAFNKIKIETAMLGGNVAYLIEQTTETAINGGQYGGTKLPSVSISGLAYTSKKVFRNEIKAGTYNLASIYILRANEFEMEQEEIRPQSFDINADEIFAENGFQKLKLNVKSLSDLTEYTIIYASNSEMVLSGVFNSRQGKKTYYNLILKKA